MSDENKELLTNTIALNLALQTIEERCVHLQKRLHALESENSQLRLSKLNNDRKTGSQVDNSLSELAELRKSNAELTMQKSQLSENLTLISTENRKLWRRLSQITKDEFSTSEKMVGLQEHLDNLDDIFLLNDYGFPAEKISYGQEDSETSDITIDSRLCTEGMINIKKELMKQNSDLKVALSNWRKMKNTACTGAIEKRPVMIDKSLETDTFTIKLDLEADVRGKKAVVDIIDQKKAADIVEKICPMCGKIYAQNCTFEEFQEHVESHFRDDTELEQLSEATFELVAHNANF